MIISDWKSLRARGIEERRVADLSTVPSIDAGNSNALATMPGDLCADFFRGCDLPRAA